MANTYTRLYVQIVFAVKGRENLIREDFRNELEKIICSIVSDNQSKVLAIYSNPEHTHVLLGLHPFTPVSKIAEAVKSGSGWMGQQIQAH